MVNNGSCCFYLRGSFGNVAMTKSANVGDDDNLEDDIDGDSQTIGLQKTMDSESQHLYH